VTGRKGAQEKAHSSRKALSRGIKLSAEKTGGSAHLMLGDGEGKKILNGGARVERGAKSTTNAP